MQRYTTLFSEWMWVVLACFLAQYVLPSLGLFPDTSLGGTTAVIPFAELPATLAITSIIMGAGLFWIRVNSGWKLDSDERVAKEILILLILWPIAGFLRFMTVDFKIIPIQFVAEVLLGCLFPSLVYMFGRSGKFIQESRSFVHSLFGSLQTGVGGLALLSWFIFAIIGYMYRSSPSFADAISRIQDELIGRVSPTYVADSSVPDIPENPKPGEITVDGNVVANIKEAFALARDGSKIHLARGHYNEAGVLRKSNVEIIAEKGAIIYGRAHGGKAAIVIKGNDTLIDGLECHSIRVRSKNGACVRLEGIGLTLRNVYFHHSQGGLVGPSKRRGTILIEDSRFEHLGRWNFFHGIYVFEGTDLFIYRSQFLNTRNGGHEIKSRARRTEIVDSVIASPVTSDSRLVDVPNGGILVMRNNLIIESEMSQNWELIGWGKEGGSYKENRVELEGNLIINDKGRKAQLLGLSSKLPDPEIRIWNNFVVGSFRDKTLKPDENEYFRNRSELGLPEAPGIPDLKMGQRQN